MHNNDDFIEKLDQLLNFASDGLNGEAAFNAETDLLDKIDDELDDFFENPDSFSKDAKDRVISSLLLEI